MEVWMNKQSGQIVLATPQWEPLTIHYDENLFKEIDPIFTEMIGDRKIAKGTLMQVGWLLQNQNDVWFGMPLSVREQFETLGEA